MNANSAIAITGAALAPSIEPSWLVTYYGALEFIYAEPSTLAARSFRLPRCIP